MKKLFLAAMLVLTAAFANAQDNYYVYGVDYTHVKVYSAKESADEFREAFININHLLMDEAAKYDFTRMLGKKSTYLLELTPIISKTAATPFDDFKLAMATANDLDCAAIVREYDLPQKSGTGIIIIAQLLNKAQGKAIYQVVKFDIASRYIMMKKQITTEAGGWGLRNYWAGSVNEVIKKVKMTEKK